jgi:hypothetical protein
MNSFFEKRMTGAMSFADATATDANHKVTYFSDNSTVQQIVDISSDGKTTTTTTLNNYVV